MDRAINFRAKVGKTSGGRMIWIPQVYKEILPGQTVEVTVRVIK
jgi:hypothetical protein